MRLLLTVFLLLLGSCAMAPRPATYVNPVIDQDFPDPSVIRAADGQYYAYATQGGDPIRNLQVARSADLVHWQVIGDALPVKPRWASRTQDFWAPDVMRADGRYYLYYSAKPDAALNDQSRGLCLGVATSDRPEGPFTDKGSPLQCGPGFENIDPHAYDDPATGKRLLYWGSGFGPIRVRELSSDRLTLAGDPYAKPLLEPHMTTDRSDYSQLMEGAWVMRHGGLYYLFFSGNNCCGKDAHYAVMVARSRSATGPYELRPKPLYLVLEGNSQWIAPGHNSVIADAVGQDWIFYHGVDARRPRSKPTDDINTRRVMLMDRLIWRDGWPEIAGKSPTNGPQPAPVTR